MRFNRAASVAFAALDFRAAAADGFRARFLADVLFFRVDVFFGGEKFFKAYFAGLFFFGGDEDNGESCGRENS